MRGTKVATSRAVLWVGQERLFLGKFNLNNQFEVHQVVWNPKRTDIQSFETGKLLTAALQVLVKQHGLQRQFVRLCLDDAFCVTRVVTGETEAVEKELEAIRTRSQLYLSLGLGEKLTGNLTEKQDGHPDYALTSIVGLRTLQAICAAIATARIRLESIEPANLALTRAMGLMGLDKDEPVMFLCKELNRCDLAISRSGRLMLSYRISGVSGAKDMANQVVSHLTRLRRFCQRVRSQDGPTLQFVYVFGEDQLVAELSNALASSTSKIHVASMELPDTLCVHNPENIASSVIVALWAALQWNIERKDCLPAPDWMEQLAKLQRVSLREQLTRNFYPCAIAAGLTLAVLGMQWNDQRKVMHKRTELELINAARTGAENELVDWESKQLLVDSFRQLERQLCQTSWDTLIMELAPCLPKNARMESFSVADDNIVTLRGMMFSTDSTYEMLSAIKQLPNIQEVSLESVSAIGDASRSQLQFEVKCRLIDQQLVPDRNKLVTATTVSRRVGEGDASSQP